MIITCLILFITSIFCYKKYTKLNTLFSNSNYLYFHGLKSFVDNYKCITITALGSIITFILCSVVITICAKVKYQDNDILYESIYYFLIFLNNCLVFLFFFYNCAFSVYAISELKHLSINDDIGLKIINSDVSIRKHAKKHFLTMHLIGLINLICTVVLSSYFNLKFLVIIIITALLLYFLGMGDVLQHTGYNSPNYSSRCKKMNIFQKMHIPNIVKIFHNPSYRKKVCFLIKYNSGNFFDGIKSITKI